MPFDLIGQERAVAALRRALDNGTVAHAYLFVGPAQVGKHALALKLAQALNCDGDEPPCDGCEPCRRIAAGIHADVQTVTVEEGEDGMQKGIHVSQIRELERVVALKPFEGRVRVIILDPAEEMNAAAQNAFLKTLEEPPPQVVLLLVAEDESRLLSTVRSRCRRLELSLPGLAAVEAALVDRGVEQDRARALARQSGSRVGRALELAEDSRLAERREESLSQSMSLGSMGVAERMGLAERLTKDYKRRPDVLLAELQAWEECWRDVLLIQAKAEEGVVNVDRLADLRREAQRFSPEDVASFVRAVGEALRSLGYNAMPRLVMEALLLQAPKGRAPALRE